MKLKVEPLTLFIASWMLMDILFLWRMTDYRPCNNKPCDNKQQEAQIKK